MPPIRILVVDDAVVARTVISEILNKEKGLEVVGTAPNGTGSDTPLVSTISNSGGSGCRTSPMRGGCIGAATP